MPVAESGKGARSAIFLVLVSHTVVSTAAILAGCTSQRAASARIAPPPASAPSAPVPASPASPASTAAAAASPEDSAAAPAPAGAYGSVPDADTCRPYLFAWPFIDAQGMAPRGGSTRGPAAETLAGPSENWTRLRAAGPAAFDKDRAAILAMAGDHRAAFDFLETAVFIPGKQAAPARPYRSWGTERIYVVADSGSFISLQHVMVMFFLNDKGARQGPMVMKHWRQDWRHEPTSLTEHRGLGLWVRRVLGREERKGAWSQTVYHVDDSPRYASLGRWEHNAAFSAWTGGAALRPLPRREHTVRSDYQVLEGRNRHTILPAGWLHEQDNLKKALTPDGSPDTALPYLAREAGVDRYDLIRGFDFSAGDAYWKTTGPFWAKVRSRWERLLGETPRLRVSETCRGEPAFAAFFAWADSTAGPRPPATREVDRALDSLFACVATRETPK